MINYALFLLSFFITFSLHAQNSILDLDFDYILEEQLNDRIFNEIQYPLKINFENNKSFSEIPIPNCNKKNTIRLYKLSTRVLHASGTSTYWKIILHPSLKAAFNDYEKNTCDHKMVYYLILNSLFYQIAKIIDSNRYSDEEKKTIYTCNKDIHLFKSSYCQYLKSVEYRYSDRSDYLEIIHFKSSNISKNRISWKDSLQEKNSDLSSEELNNAQEAFAIQFSKFITQKKFSCDQPNIARFFSKKFSVPLIPCWQDTNIKNSNNGEVEALDPEKFYRLEVVVANSGDKIYQWFGHIFLKLVFCAPERTEKNAECLKDISSHRVFSFEAENITEDEANSWKGLTGQYTTHGFFYSWIEVEDIYKKYNRSLQILPMINLKKEDLDYFFYHLLAVHKWFRGTWYHLTENCASNTFNLFKIFNDPEIISKNSVLPMQTYSLLQKWNKRYDTP